jgi:hypothetical protein
MLMSCKNSFGPSTNIRIHVLLRDSTINYKSPSILYSSNQEINPNVGNQQLHVEATKDLAKVSIPNKSKPPSP